MNSKANFKELEIPLSMGIIAARWYGNQNERPIIALHGWQDNAGTFALLAPILCKQVAILAIDLPGHGRSSHFPNGCIYHTQDFVRVLRELIQFYKLPKISLMGHSMSCAVIYQYASLYPESVDIIISIDVLHTRYFKLDQQIGMLKFFLEKFLKDTERKQETKNKSNAEPPCYTLEEMAKALHLGSEKSVDLDKTKYILERNIRPSRKQSDKFNFSRDTGIKYLLENYTEPKLTEAMAKRICNIKWLVLKAEHSYHINEDNPTTQMVFKILKENNRDFFYYVLPGVKHHCHLNNSEMVAEYILPFLKKFRPVEYLPYRAANKL
ncbi:hypothetical protein DOY81_008587 [Sarcophaga bullata]|nr:hypothetical protein DOY81_008587 [Sarcophaga bullata]